MTGVYRHDPSDAGNDGRYGRATTMSCGHLDAVTGRLADLIPRPAAGQRRLPRLFPQFNAYICQCCHRPKCRHDHRLKQRPRWRVDQLPDGTFQKWWTTPAYRSYTTEPTRYPI
jgi:hypothetical protein